MHRRLRETKMTHSWYVFDLVSETLLMQRSEANTAVRNFFKEQANLVGFMC